MKRRGDWLTTIQRRFTERSLNCDMWFNEAPVQYGSNRSSCHVTAENQRWSFT